MITVRFPTGFSIQYNSLRHIKWQGAGRGALLYASKPDGTCATGWSVSIPEDCIVEFAQPCRTYNASNSPDTLQAEVAALRKEVRALGRKIGKGTK